MVDSDETEVGQTTHLFTIMNDIAQTVKLTILQFLLCSLDSTCHAKAESRAVVNFDYSHRRE